MKAQPYERNFTSREDAISFMNLKNKGFERAGNTKDILCVVPGKENGFAVVDLRTAINLGLGYTY